MDTLIRVCAFSEKGKALCRGDGAFVTRENEELSEWVKESFEKRIPLLFIGAAGIAVRAIAPFVKDKLTDIPVLVMDEKAQYIIPILSGHMGGANELARKLAIKFGATPVITTATDVENTFAVDVFAKRNGLKIVNREGIQKVSSKILEKKKITMCIGSSIEVDTTGIPSEIELITYPPTRHVDVLITEEEERYDATLHLCPKLMVLGIGCKKGKSFEELENFVLNYIDEEFWADIYGVASIDLKKEEQGLVDLARIHGVPFYTYSKEELLTVEGDFTDSEFVKNTTGVANVCERSALYCAGKNGKLMMRKQASNGMTFAMAYRRAKIETWETTNE